MLYSKHINLSFTERVMSKSYRSEIKITITKNVNNKNNKFREEPFYFIYYRDRVIINFEKKNFYFHSNFDNINKN